MVRVNAVNHVDPWYGIAQRVRQTVDLHVATEAVRRIEGGQVQEASGRLIARHTPCRTPTSVAAASQVSRRQPRPSSRISRRRAPTEHSARADVRSARRADDVQAAAAQQLGKRAGGGGDHRTAAGTPRWRAGRSLPSTKAAPGPLRDSRGQPALHPNIPGEEDPTGQAEPLDLPLQGTETTVEDLVLNYFPTMTRRTSANSCEASSANAATSVSRFLCGPKPPT